MIVTLELAGRPAANVKRVTLRGTTVIGRSRDCQLRIASGSISRRHCEVRVDEEGVTVVDLDSSNGTFIDAERLPPNEPRPVPPGSQLSVGGVLFVVRYQLPGGPPEPGSTVEFRGRQPADDAPLDPDDTRWATSDETAALPRTVPATVENAEVDEVQGPDQTDLAEIEISESPANDLMTGDDEPTVAAPIIAAARVEDSEAAFDIKEGPLPDDLANDDAEVVAVEEGAILEGDELLEEESLDLGFPLDELAAEGEMVAGSSEDFAFGFLHDEESSDSEEAVDAASDEDADSRLGDFLRNLGGN